MRIKAIEKRIFANAVAKAIEFVSDEMKYFHFESEDERRLYAALSAMNYVQANLSMYRWNVRLGEGADLSNVPVGRSLAEGVGLCGNHVVTFQTILNALDVPTRWVEVYYIRPNGSRLGHSMSEVLWGDKWHLFDVTWGTVPIGSSRRDILALEDIRTGRKFDMARNYAQLSVFHNLEHDFEPFEYLDLDFDVLYDKRGTIRPALEGSSFDLEYLPKYIGRVTNPFGAVGDIEYLLEIPAAATLNIEAKHWHCKAGGNLVVNGADYPFSKTMKFENLVSPARLGIRSNSDKCYMVIAALTVE